MRVPTGGWMGEASAAEVFEDIERPDEINRSEKGEKRYVSTSAKLVSNFQVWKSKTLGSEKNLKE
jgi:hypothetical protein